MPIVSLIIIIILRDSSLAAKICVFPIFLKYKIEPLIFENIEEKLNLSGNMVHAWTLFVLCGKALFLCHYVATAYYLLAIIEKDYLEEKNSWLDLAGLADSPPLD